MRHPLLSGLALCLVLALAGCQASLPPLPGWQSPEGRAHAQLGQITDLASGRLISPEQLVRQLADAPRVLVGEKHDNPDHHALQLWLLRALQAQRPQGSLLLEMLQPEQQPLVDKLEAQQTLPADLPKALAWEDGWDWQLYGPIVTHALQGDIALLAANLSPAQMRQAYRQPAALSGARSNAPGVKAALLEQGVGRDRHGECLHVARRFFGEAGQFLIGHCQDAFFDCRFQLLFHFFNCFSRVIAALTSSVSST